MVAHPDAATASALITAVVIVHEYPVRRPFKVLELPAIEGPPEHRADGEYKRNRKGNQQVQDFHETAS